MSLPSSMSVDDHGRISDGRKRSSPPPDDNEPSLRQVMLSLHELSAQVKDMGNGLRAEIAGQNKKISHIEERLLTLESGSVIPSTAGPPGLESVGPGTEYVWLAGGWADASHAADCQTRLLKMQVTMLDSWISRGAKPLLFFKFITAEQRIQFQCLALPFLKEHYPSVWSKFGRSQSEERNLTKARHLMSLLKKQKPELEVAIRSKDMLVMSGDKRLARFSDGRERWNWENISSLTGLTEEQILQGMVHLDEVP
eukprot:3198127-Amphidinium_carterae.2